MRIIPYISYQVNNDTVVQGALEGATLVSVNNLVEENVIRDNEKRSVSFSSWIQVDDVSELFYLVSLVVLFLKLYILFEI